MMWSDGNSISSLTAMRPDWMVPVMTHPFPANEKQWSYTKYKGSGEERGI